MPESGCWGNDVGKTVVDVCISMAGSVTSGVSAAETGAGVSAGRFVDTIGEEVGAVAIDPHAVSKLAIKKR